MNDRQLTIVTDDGQEIICNILFTYHSDEFNKDYVVFVKADTNECSAASYTPLEDGQGKLDVIENEEEWKMLESVLDDWVSKNQEMSECGGCNGSCQGCGSSCGEECDCDGDCNCGQ